MKMNEYCALETPQHAILAIYRSLKTCRLVLPKALKYIFRLICCWLRVYLDAEVLRALLILLLDFLWNYLH